MKSASHCFPVTSGRGPLSTLVFFPSFPLSPLLSNAYSRISSRQATGTFRARREPDRGGRLSTDFIRNPRPSNAGAAGAAHDPAALAGGQHPPDPLLRSHFLRAELQGVLGTHEDDLRAAATSRAPRSRAEPGVHPGPLLVQPTVPTPERRGARVDLHGLWPEVPPPRRLRR